MYDRYLGAYDGKAIGVSCEHPRVIVNRRYTKYGDHHPIYSANADYYLKVPCGRCRLCKGKLANEWKVRLEQELRATRSHFNYSEHKVTPRVVFTTLTIAPEYYQDNDKWFAPYFVKFRDNYRKKYGRSPRYFAITDRGSQYARIHIHLLLFDPRYYDCKTKQYTRDIPLSDFYENYFWWPYGMVRETEWVRGFGAHHYLTGYITGANLDKDEPVKHGKPICEKALKYKPRVFVSNGLGRALLDDPKEVERMRETNMIQQGDYMYGIPRYYQTHIFSETERYFRLIYRQAEQRSQMAYYARHSSTTLFRYRQREITRQAMNRLVRDAERFYTPPPPKYTPIPIPYNEYFYPHLYDPTSPFVGASLVYGYYEPPDYDPLLLNDWYFIHGNGHAEECPF